MKNSVTMGIIASLCLSTFIVNAEESKVKNLKMLSIYPSHTMISSQEKQVELWKSLETITTLHQ